MAFLDPLTNLLGLSDANPPRIAGTSGFFGTEEQGQELGGLFADMLIDLLGGVEKSEEFRRGKQVIRDATDVFGKTQRQRLGDTATTGGFLDSGAVREGELGIARQEQAAFTKGINELFFGLSQRRDQLALPFLQSAADESLQIDLANLQSEQFGQQLDFQRGVAVLDFASNFIPAGGGTPFTG